MAEDQSSSPTLYILPNLIGERDTFLKMILLEHPEIRKLSHFFVEKEKPARALFKSLELESPQSDIILTSIGKHHSADQYLSALEKINYNIGLVSDAGVPGVADPGSSVVMKAHKLGFRVIPLAGPSSIINALSASGLNGQQFSFHGYLPIGPNELKAKLINLINSSRKTGFTQIFIEAPYRNMQLLESIKGIAGEDIYLCIASGIQTSQEYIRTRKMTEWKISGFPAIHKIPSVFLIGHGI